MDRFNYQRAIGRGQGTGDVIVNLSSGAAVLGAPGRWVNYAARKRALDTMTVGLAKHVAAEGTRSNAVRPAGQITPMKGKQ